MTQPQNPTPDEDIREAVQNSGEKPWYSDPKWFVPYPVPITRSRYVLIFWLARCISWGVTSAAYKIVAATKKHPWRMGIGVLAGIAMCPVCVYSTGCIIGGMAIWAVRSETQAHNELPLDDAPMQPQENSAGEFMQ